MAFICLEASSQCASQTVIQNPNFQGSGNDTFPPHPWIGCNGGMYANYTVSSGNVVISSTNNPNASFYGDGSITQLLNMPLVIGIEYIGTINLSNIGGICSCEIYGGYSACDETGQLLWNSTNSMTSGSNTFTFHAGGYYTYITIVNHFNPQWGGSGGQFTVTSFTLNSSATPLVVTVQLNNNACSGGANGGDATAHATGYSPFTYAWSNGQTDSVLHNAGSGIYEVTVTDSHGCINNDSIDVGQMQPLTSTISVLGDTLISQPASTYQWYLNGHIITGATNQDYVPTQNGNYYDIITNSYGCASPQSNIIYISNATGIESISDNRIYLFPNPATNTITIQTQSVSSFIIYDLAGREIISAKLKGGENNFSVSQLSKGIYLVRITQGENTYCQKVVIK